MVTGSRVRTWTYLRCHYSAHHRRWHQKTLIEEWNNEIGKGKKATKSEFTRPPSQSCHWGSGLQEALETGQICFGVTLETGSLPTNCPSLVMWWLLVDSDTSDLPCMAESALTTRKKVLGRERQGFLSGTCHQEEATSGATFSDHTPFQKSRGPECWRNYSWSHDQRPLMVASIQLVSQAIMSQALYPGCDMCLHVWSAS